MMTNNISSEETSKILPNDNEICSTDGIAKSVSPNETKSLNEPKTKHVAFSDVDTSDVDVEKKASTTIPEEIQDDEGLKEDAHYLKTKDTPLEKLRTVGLEPKFEYKPETAEEVDTEPGRHSDNQSSKVSGYLGKKGRLRMVSSWKKYWFVLEGRLLLYYRSKAEYDTLSPCKGSITLRSPCNIKPGSASNCVFQLEMRNHTITLRAENRADQDKWMIAILGALKQTQSTNRMSHFRYSADDLAVRTKADNPPALVRQNTLPDRVSLLGDTPPTPKIKTMVERIESIGGQSYIVGQTLQTPECITKLSKASPKLPKNTHLKKLLDKQLTDGATGEGEWVHEELEMINDLYATVDVPKDRHIYQEISAHTHVEPEVVVENANYEEMDVNRNKIEEYWEPLYDSRAIYADVELFQPVLPPRPKSQEPANNLKTEKKGAKTTKMRKRQSFVHRIFNRIKRHETPKVDGNAQNEEPTADMPVNDGKCVNDSSSEEEKISIQDSEQIEQVSQLNEHGAGADLSPMVVKELSNIIHAKLVEEKNAAEETKPLDKPCQDQNPDDDNKTEAETPSLDQLCQLQQPQTPLITNQHSQQDLAQSDEDSQCTENIIDKVNDNDFDYNRLYNPNNRLNIPRPKLLCKPKRQKRRKDDCEDHHTTVRYYQHCTDDEQVVPHFKDDSKLVTIEEILDDLENHNYESFSRQKVKDLIEKFNEREVDEDGKDEEQIHVQLRHHRPEQTQELSSLLEELSKVANLPLSPRNIAIEHNGLLGEEEWKNILPLRKRRHSDPDYDIPRPHSALHIIPNNDKEETKMQPTRFFGPVIIEQLNGDTSCGTSITPDSLEIDVLSYQAKNYTPSIEEDRSMRSYTSHIYTSNDSHLNNTCTLNSHHHQTSNSDGNNPTNEETVENLARPPTLTPLTAPKTECEQAFYLKRDDDNNNNVPLLTAEENDDTHNAHATKHGAEDIVSPCFDSLEPSTVTTQE